MHDQIVHELFDSMRREVYEESNIPAESLSELLMIGAISYLYTSIIFIPSCTKTRGRQVQLFCCFSNLTKEEVKQNYEKGPVDQYESLGINFFSLEEIIDMIVGIC